MKARPKKRTRRKYRASPDMQRFEAGKRRLAAKRYLDRHPSS